MPKNSKKLIAVAKKPFVSVKQYVQEFKTRRPHTSFMLTRKRDYRRSLALPGYFAFTRSVNKTLIKYRKVLIPLAIVYGLLSALFIGVGSQDTYSTLTQTLQETGNEVFAGNLSELGKAGLVFFSIAGSGLNTAPTESQQIFTIILALLIWLTTVWLLRTLLAGNKAKMRDGLYNAGTPIIGTFFVGIVLVLQLIPVGIAMIGYSAADSTGLLSSGVAAMLFWAAALLLAILSLYLVTSTFFALIIVTLPGMYPGRALRTAGDMVIGRRLRILLRVLWMFGCIAVAWAIILIPFILIDSGLKQLLPVIEGLPIIPIVLLILGVLSFIWSASYVYLLYRKVVDDDAKPA